MKTQPNPSVGPKVGPPHSDRQTRTQCPWIRKIIINLWNCHFRGWQVLLVLLWMSAGVGFVVRANDLSRDIAAKPAVSGSWSITDPMEYERYWFAATTLMNGRVLVTGGYSYEYYDLDTAELYDSRTDHWRETGRMRAARYSHTATLLADG